MTNVLRDYLDKTGALPADVLLGNVVYYTIRDGAYDVDDLRKSFDELNLDPKFLPAQNRAIDAFKKATNEVNDFEYTLKNGNIAHVLVRDVTMTDEMVERHFIREIRDSRRRTLAHDKVGEAVFYRARVEKGTVVQGSHRIRLNILVPGDDPEREPLQTVVDKIDTSFGRYSTYLDGMKVRATVREYIKSLSGIELKPSVYFIPITKAEELKRVSQLVERLGHGCTMDLMPLVDMSQQRETILRSYQDDAAKDFTALVESIQKLHSTRKNISAEAFAKIRAEYDAIAERTSEYRKSLRIASDTTAGYAEQADAALKQLAETMLFGGRS